MRTRRTGVDGHHSVDRQRRAPDPRAWRYMTARREYTHSIAPRRRPGRWQELDSRTRRATMSARHCHDLHRESDRRQGSCDQRQRLGQIAWGCMGEPSAPTTHRSSRPQGTRDSFSRSTSNQAVRVHALLHDRVGARSSDPTSLWGEGRGRQRWTINRRSQIAIAISLRAADGWFMLPPQLLAGCRERSPEPMVS